MAVDGGDQQRAGLVAGADLIHVRTRGDQHLRGVEITAARRQDQSGVAALRIDQLVVEVGAIDAGRAAATEATAASTTGTLRSRGTLPTLRRRRHRRPVSALAVATGLIAATGSLRQELLFAAAQAANIVHFRRRLHIGAGLDE